MANDKVNDMDPEIIAISEVYASLKNLDSEAQSRVLSYVAGKLKIKFHTSDTHSEIQGNSSEYSTEQHGNENDEDDKDQFDDEIEGISPVAKKWMLRNGLTTKQLSEIFSLGIDEIDLIAKTVPGKNKKERMHSVFLLKGVAAYLGTGAARFAHEQMKEACLHYDAYDSSNFAVYLKSYLSDISGSKELGYTLTARGLASATEMVKAMTEDQVK